VNNGAGKRGASKVTQDAQGWQGKCEYEAGALWAEGLGVFLTVRQLLRASCVPSLALEGLLIPDIWKVCNFDQMSFDGACLTVARLCLLRHLLLS
jgi:hypothetical protein